MYFHGTLPQSQINTIIQGVCLVGLQKYWKSILGELKVFWLNITNVSQKKYGNTIMAKFYRKKQIWQYP